MSASRATARLEKVLARCDAYMRKLARGYARGRPEFQEDLLQEARVAIYQGLRARRTVRSDFRPVIMGAMQEARRRELRHTVRFESLDALLDLQEWRARVEEQEEAA